MAQTTEGGQAQAQPDGLGRSPRAATAGSITGGTLVPDRWPDRWPEPEPPVLDADGLLRHAGRWVPIPDTQLPVADLLVRNLGSLVRRREIRDTYVAAGGSGSATSLRSVVHRLGRRVATVGLHLHVVHGRGVVLVSEPVLRASDVWPAS